MSEPVGRHEFEDLKQAFKTHDERCEGRWESLRERLKNGNDRMWKLTIAIVVVGILAAVERGIYWIEYLGVLG